MNKGEQRIGAVVTTLPPWQEGWERIEIMIEGREI